MNRVDKNESNSKRCQCPNCPSYNDCAQEKEEFVFCTGEVGKSSCAFPMHGCICGGCAVHEQYNLKESYYCINGSADETEK
jgi:hypothetical protein